MLNGGGPRERCVARRDGTGHYLMRVLPYRDASDAYDGVLITFTDVTRIIRA